jgi:hypothetical protein
MIFQHTFENFQEPAVSLEEIESWLFSDQDVIPPGAVDDGSVDPAGFYLDIFQDVGELQQDEDDEVTFKDLFGDEDEMDLQVPAPAEADGGYEKVTLEALFGDEDDMDLQVVPRPAPAEDHGIYEEVTYGSLFGGSAVTTWTWWYRRRRRCLSRVEVNHYMNVLFPDRC